MEKKLTEKEKELIERAVSYREMIYGYDEDAAKLAWDMLLNDTEVDPTIALGFVEIEGGDMELGANKQMMHIDGGWSMCAYTTTQRLWKWVTGEEPSHFKGSGLLPVEQVSWDDVQEFIAKLNKLFKNVEFSLPDEYEWEFAARGGVKSKGYKYAGSDDLDEVAWYAIIQTLTPILSARKT